MGRDILIVGARAAGASLGLLLAQRGYRVLLVDRDRFPSDTMSTHYIHPFQVPLLARLGVLDELLAAGFRRMTRARTYVDDCLFEAPIAPAPAFALAPRRDVLDMLLVEHAVRYGAEFVDRTRVERLRWHGDRVVGAELASRSGGTRRVDARVVVGADGKASSVAKWVGAETYNAVPAMRPAYYGHYQGVAPLDEPALELFFGGDRIGFVFPMRPGEDCLAMEMQPDDFAAARTRPQEYFEERFRGLPGMARRLSGARLDGKLIGTQGIENYFRKPYGPGWVLAGDAAYLKDPSTGLGIGDALQQALWLADALDASLQGADWEATMRQFHQTRDEATMPLYQTTLNFTAMRDPAAEDIAWIKAVFASPGLARTLLYQLPTALPGLLPPAALGQAQGLAAGFGARPDATAVPTHA